jgi:cytochrome c oxidase assembly protein subunit 15
VLPSRLSAAQYHRVTGLALVAIVFIIVTGASVRLTGSGLGCREWPTCEAGQLVAPLEFHPMVEFGNRVVTGLVSAAVIVAVLGSLVRRPRRADLTRWSLGLVAGVAAQAVLGAVSVKMELAPAFISAHFLLSIVLVWNSVVLNHRAGLPDTPPVPVVDRAGVLLGRAVLALAVAVLVTGTLVTGTGPHAGDEGATRYTFATIGDVARLHSLTVWVFLIASVAALARLRRGAPAQVDARARLLVTAIVFQGALGYAQYAAGVPPFLVILHVLGSVLVFVAALRFHLSLFARPDVPVDLRSAEAAVEAETVPLAPA